MGGRGEEGNFGGKRIKGSVNLSGRSVAIRNEKWKVMLVGVGGSVRMLRPSIYVKPLYDMVASHLEDAISHIISRNISEWYEISQSWKKSREFFKLVRDVSSAFHQTGGESIYDVFEALVKGFSFKDAEWNRQDTTCKRSAFLLDILGETGSYLQQLDQCGYYDKVIGEGSSAPMKKIYSVLQGRGLDADKKELNQLCSYGSSDWRAKLASVMEIMDDMNQPTGTEWILESVREVMRESVQAIKYFDIEDSEKWESILSILHARLLTFRCFKQAPGSIGKVFKSLYEGLKLEIDGPDKWMSIIGLNKRNAKINTILEKLGKRLDDIDNADYTQCLPVDEAQHIKNIASILMGNSTFLRKHELFSE